MGRTEDWLLRSGVPLWLKLSLLLWWDGVADQPVLPQLRGWIPECFHRPGLLIVDEDLTVLLTEELKYKTEQANIFCSADFNLSDFKENVFYPVTLQRRQHLLSQLDLPKDLIDAVAAAQEWLRDRKKQKEGKKGKEWRISEGAVYITRWGPKKQTREGKEKIKRGRNIHVSYSFCVNLF